MRRVAFCSMSDRPAHTQHSWKRIQEYCDRHGYTFLTRTETSDPSRHQAWNKISFLIEIVSQYDVSICIDDDIMLTNVDKPLDEFLDAFDKSGAVIALQADKFYWADPVNTGFVFAKPSALSLLEHLWHNPCGFETKRNWEQSAFATLFHTNPAIKNHVHIFPPRKIQSFYRQTFFNDPPEFTWQPGDFAAHTSGGAPALEYLYSGGCAPFSEKFSD